MRKILFIVGLALCSCATIHKNTGSSQLEEQALDTSSHTHDYEKETSTEEKSTAPVKTTADSLQTSGTISAEDTTTHEQTVETDDMSLTTIIKPKTNSKGKITGYDVNSKAVAKSKTVDVPIDRKTTIKEKGSDKQQTGITATKREVVTTSTKKIFRFNFAGAAAIVGGIVAMLLFLYLGGRFIKSKKNKD